MAVAEKAVTEKSPRTPQQALPLASLMGALYLLIGLGVVFTGLPWLWSQVLDVNAYLENEFLSGALLLITTLAVAAGFIYGAVKLERNPPAGFRAGTFFLSLSLLVVVWVTLRVGMELASARLGATGLVLMVAIGAGLVLGILYVFSRPEFCRWLIKVEEQGWFHARSYKGNQGLRVRRGTIIALLAIGFSGIITLAGRSALLSSEDANNWSIAIPFSEPVFGAYARHDDGKLIVAYVEKDSPASRGGLRADDVITEIDQKEVTAKTDLDELTATKKPGDNVRMKVDRQVGQETRSEDATVTLGSAMLPILYNVNVMLPLILSALLVWVAWRVVHLPTFADFLIATEAEMNKVSWTTRRRLVQDTIVVLVTVVLMAVFLLLVDLLWINALSAVNVLQVNIRAEHQKQQEKSQW